MVYQPVKASQPALKLEDMTGLYLTDGALPVIIAVPLSPSSPHHLDPLQVVFVTKSSSSPRRFIHRLSMARRRRRMRPLPFTDDPALTPGVMAMACLAVMVTPLVVISSSTSMIRIPVSLFRLLLLVFAPPGPELPDQLLVGVELLLQGLDALGHLGAAVPAAATLVSQLLHQQVDFYLRNDALLDPFIHIKQT
jgi:hypothetical protein